MLFVSFVEFIVTQADWLWLWRHYKLSENDALRIRIKASSFIWD